jgi:hypothetical protein
MGRMTWHCTVPADRQAVLLELMDDGETVAQMVMDGATTETLAHDLAKCRARLVETVPQELDPGARVDAVGSPAWGVQGRHSGPADTLLLALRHPGFGWLAFVLERERARAMAKALSRLEPGRK